MRIGIMQPTYLPWLGYFEMISRVDIFVLLDSVQFEKKSWQHRNKIKSSRGEQLLTVPVLTASRFSQTIADVEIFQGANFIHKHLESIKQSYARAPFFNDFYPGLAEVLSSDESSLRNFNEKIIRFICDYLGITSTIIRASSLNSHGRGTELTVLQCKELGASTFYAAKGSQSYVSLETGFEENGIIIQYQDYDHPVYQQQHGEFIPYLSTIDLIFNCGPLSSEIMRGQHQL